MKIGIITHYYGSLNYGGNLQAYALCRYLNELGHVAEQISYDKSCDPAFWWSGKAKQILKTGQRLLVPKRKTTGSHDSDMVAQLIARRNKKILQFNSDVIPHTEKVYTAKTITQANKDFDLFITGSDQVWHPYAVCGAYLLDFVDPALPRASYAASLAVEKLTAHQERRYKKSIKKFAAVSVRESQSIEQIQKMTNVKVVQTLDPTLLVSASMWEELCAERQVKEDYVFAFFLGADALPRTRAAEFAKRKSLKLVTIPYLQGEERACDRDFGDFQLYDIGPQ